MDDVETSQMSFKVENCADSTNIVTSRNVSQMSWLIDNPTDNLILLQIQSHWISVFDVRVWESDGSSVVSNDVWDFVRADGFGNNFTKLEVSFSVTDFD